MWTYRDQTAQFSTALYNTYIHICTTTTYMSVAKCVCSDTGSGCPIFYDCGMPRLVRRAIITQRNGGQEATNLSKWWLVTGGIITSDMKHQIISTCMLLPQQGYVHGQDPSCLSEGGTKFRFRTYLKESTQAAKHYVSDTTLSRHDLCCCVCADSMADFRTLSIHHLGIIFQCTLVYRKIKHVCLHNLVIVFIRSRDVEPRQRNSIRI